MHSHNCGRHPEVRDYGAEPFIFNISHATNMNRNFRTTLWTGCHTQLTLMCIPVGGDIGVEMHEDVDHFHTRTIQTQEYTKSICIALISLSLPPTITVHTAKST